MGESYSLIDHLVIVLRDHPTIYLEQLLDVSRENEKVIGGVLIQALEYILNNRKELKKFVDDMSQI